MAQVPIWDRVFPASLLRKVGVRFIVSAAILCTCFEHDGQASQVSESQNANNVISLTLSPSRDQFELGTPILVTITLTNVSQKDVVWESERPDPAYRNFQFSLKADSESEVPMTVYHRKIRGKQLPSDPIDVYSGSSAFATLAPGKSVHFTVDLRKIFEIAKPGVYKLVVARTDELNKMKVKSEPRDINIVR